MFASCRRKFNVLHFCCIRESVCQDEWRAGIGVLIYRASVRNHGAQCSLPEGNPPFNLNPVLPDTKVFLGPRAVFSSWIFVLGAHRWCSSSTLPRPAKRHICVDIQAQLLAPAHMGYWGVKGLKGELLGLIRQHSWCCVAVTMSHGCCVLTLMAVLCQSVTQYSHKLSKSAPNSHVTLHTYTHTQHI